MKKSILDLGKALNKADQKIINGGFRTCATSEQCSGRYDCCSHGVCISTRYAFFQPHCS